MSEDVPIYRTSVAAITARNPTGIVLTQEQRDDSERSSYWYNAIVYGLQYYIAGRFATAHRFIPVSANILHHAVELLLKACLAYEDPLHTIRKYGHRDSYGHDIVRLWNEFKARQKKPVPTEFDSVIVGLAAFESIRYPEMLVRKGARISIGIFENNPPLVDDSNIPEKRYDLVLPEIDRLVGLLFDASGANPEAFLPEFTDDKQSMVYYEMIRRKLFDRSTAF